MNCAETKGREGANVQYNPIAAELLEEIASKRRAIAGVDDESILFMRAAATIQVKDERIAELEARAEGRAEANASDSKPGDIDPASIKPITAGDFEALAAEAELSVGCGGFAVAFRRAAGEIRRLEDRCFEIAQECKAEAIGAENVEAHYRRVCAHRDELIEQNREATAAIARAEEIRREQQERIAELEGKATGCCQADTTKTRGPAQEADGAGSLEEVDELIALIQQGQVSPVSARVMHALRGASRAMAGQAKAIGEEGHARNEAAVKVMRLEAELAEKGAEAASLESRLGHWKDRAEKVEAQRDALLEGVAKEDGFPNVVHTLAVDVTDLLRNPVAAVEPAGSIEGFLGAMGPNSKMTIILERGE